MKMVLLVAASLTAVTVMACSSNPEAAPAPSPIEDAGVDTTDRSVTYGPCPPSYLGECTKIQEPLDHAAPGGETIDFHVARYPSATQPAKRQVWLLAGGPGQAGYVFAKSLPAFAAAVPDTDFYVPDHRGTGYSHRLTCPQQDTEGTVGGLNLAGADAKACLEALKKKGDDQRLPHFTTTQAAQDVLDAIARTKKPDQKAYVWGFSYGTHLAYRMMQIDPNALEGIVFDGFLTPQHFSSIGYDRGAQEVGELFAAGCDRDPSCSSHLGTGGVPGGTLAKMKSVLAKLATARCGVFNREDARTVWSILLDSAQLRTLVFPMVHRLDRCSNEDKVALKFMITTYNELASGVFETPLLNSGALQYNITLWELWATPGELVGTKEELVAKADAQEFLQARSLAADVYDARAFWPKAPDDYSRYPIAVATRTKQLWLGGTHDLHAYPSQANALRSVIPGATYVNLEGASHTPSAQSPLASDPKVHCGMQMMTKFTATDGEVDTSCATAMMPVLYEAKTGAFAKKLWNTEDDWGDGTPKP